MVSWFEWGWLLNWKSSVQIPVFVTHTEDTSYTPGAPKVFGVVPRGAVKHLEGRRSGLEKKNAIL